MADTSFRATEIDGPFYDDLKIGDRFEGAPTMRLTDGMAAAHHAIVGGRLRLAFDAELSASVTGQPAPFAAPAFVWDVAIGLFGKNPASWRFVANLLCAFLPSAVIGLALHHYIEALLGAPKVVAVALIIGGIAILLIERAIKPGTIEGVDRIPYARAMGIGFIQCLAMVPGVSRSGATIMGALSLGISRRTAAEFSFFLAIPTMLGATTLEVVKNHEALMTSAVNWTDIVLGFVVSFLVAIVVIKWFVGLVARHGFGTFAWYRIIAGTAALIWLFAR